MRYILRVVLGIAVILGGFATPAYASLNDFRIINYKAELILGRDSEQRSTLQTVETITAEFPQIDQNHGIERAIPKKYNGHSTHVAIKSIKDTNGASYNYTTYDSNDNLVVRIGDKDTYVHGSHTYVLSYEQHDVTKFFADTSSDEFYWDINGVEWQVPIDSLSVSLTIDTALQSAYKNQVQCYKGANGASGKCELRQNDGTFETSASGLNPGENITVALGFEKGTFGEYKASLAETLLTWWLLVQAAVSVVAIAVGSWLITKFIRLTNRDKEMGTIVPEYLPPKDSSVTVAAQIAKQRSMSVMSAQLIDLAVRHYIKLYQVKEKTLFSPPEYEIEVIKDPSDLLWEEKELLSDSFGSLPAIGQRLNLKTLRNNMSFYKNTLNNDSDLTKLIRGEYGLRELNVGAKQTFRRTALIIGVLSIILLSPALAIVALIVFSLSFVVWSLTDKGLALRRYLEGLKMYIATAEAERLKMLQSPEGAEKVASVTNGATDQTQLIKLYERVLPYAVLFGQEKEWNKQLGVYYEQTNTQPYWYSGGSGIYNAAAFSSAMSGLSSATSYASSSSSSSGGSAGGGSSGGGGGGGGGGGW
jgi:uncharacterized membrane protein YgcG